MEKSSKTRIIAQFWFDQHYYKSSLTDLPVRTIRVWFLETGWTQERNIPESKRNSSYLSDLGGMTAVEVPRPCLILQLGAHTHLLCFPQGHRKLPGEIASMQPGPFAINSESGFLPVFGAHMANRFALREWWEFWYSAISFDLWMVRITACKSTNKLLFPPLPEIKPIVHAWFWGLELQFLKKTVEMKPLILEPLHFIFKLKF